MADIKGKSKEAFIGRLYSNQVGSSKKRGHRPPEYSKSDLIDWLFSQKLFHTLYSEWVMSGFDKDLIPSIDRKCDDVHYCMNNIQLMTWRENRTKGHSDRRNGVNTSLSMAVEQFTKGGEFVASFVSFKEAERITGVSNSHISKVCKGKRKTAGGFIWRVV